MDFRRTRRNVLCATAGLGLSLAAGCLDDGTANGTDERGGTEDGGGDRPTYQEWVLAASASSETDISELTFAEFGLTEIDAVSGSLPAEMEGGLRESAYADVRDVVDELETDTIDTTFTFNARATDDSPGSVRCRGLKGPFDVDPVREKIETEPDMDHQQIAGFDVYSESWASIAIRSSLVVQIIGELGAEETKSLLERVESADFESGGDGDSDDFEILVGHLDDGATAIGDFRSSMTRDGVSGWGGSVAFDNGEAKTRLVTLYDDVPDDETIRNTEIDVEEGRWFGGYDDTTVEATGRVIIITARVETERLHSIPW